MIFNIIFFLEYLDFLENGKVPDSSVSKSDMKVQIRHMMLRDELTQKFSHFDKITVFGCPRACRFRKYQI
jgi:hypothetical protein